MGSSRQRKNEGERERKEKKSENKKEKGGEIERERGRIRDWGREIEIDREKER